MYMNSVQMCSDQGMGQVEYPTVRSLIVLCPVCGEEMEFTEEDLSEIQLGDILGCDACETELEVLNTGENLELEPLALYTVCPKCDKEFEITEEMLAKGDKVSCPHCKYHFELEFEED
jgi:predicted Zn finger-like uncharacterized protein